MVGDPQKKNVRFLQLHIYFMSSSLSCPSLIEKDYSRAELTTDMTILLISSADPEGGGGTGGPDPPLENRKLYGFL